MAGTIMKHMNASADDATVNIPDLRTPKRCYVGAARLGLAIVLALAASSLTFGRLSVQAQSLGSTPITIGSSPGENAWVLRDAYGREITLRGFNVSGSSKLVESGFLPFRSTTDATVSAQAMRDLTGANVIRFLISWQGTEPSAAPVDTAYLAQAAAQIREFTDRGFYVLIDYHQDLYSQHLFNINSWYTGDGAPAWVITAGSYPAESCGICLLWGQNMLSNAAVRDAMHDFWHNRAIATSAGTIGVQDAYISQAAQVMTYLRETLPAAAFQNIVGVDPFNEPFDGGLDGAAGTTWEQTYLMPFYRRFRAAMDSAGWADKLAFVEPLVFWNQFASSQGGLSTIGSLGSRYVFNSHYYDGARMTIDPFAAGDGTYSGAIDGIRDRAATVATAAFVSEFGSSMTDTRTPWMVRSMYESLDHSGNGSDWWTAPAGRGHVLSSTQWHWDIYSGRHHEPMNGNPSKLQTAADAFNGEDYSLVESDVSGNVVLRLDQHVLDRIYPSAVAGDTLAFATEDLASSGFAGAGTGAAWLTVPAQLSAIQALTAGKRYGVLVWRASAAACSAPTELHLPASFDAASTVVLSDLGSVFGVPAFGPVALANETGSTKERRLLLTSPCAAGAVHFALVVDGAGLASQAIDLAAATRVPQDWQTSMFP
jgi:hypothetical protein